MGSVIMHKLIANIANSLILFSILLIFGCAAPIASSVGYYGPTPTKEKVKGSYGHWLQTFAVEHDTEDVRKAIIKAAAINGLTFDVIKKDMLSGFAQWVPPGFTGGCTPNQVYAVYISTAGKRKTSVTIVADHLSLCASGHNPQLLLVQRLGTSMNSVLATYD
jgi:hypothetical protein